MEARFWAIRIPNIALLAKERQCWRLIVEATKGKKTERLENLEVQISARAVELLTLLFLDCSVIAQNVPKLLFRTISETTNENTCGKIEPKRGSRKKKGEVCAGFALYAERRLIPKRVRTFVRRNAKRYEIANFKKEQI